MAWKAQCIASADFMSASSRSLTASAKTFGDILGIDHHNHDDFFGFETRWENAGRTGRRPILATMPHWRKLVL
jgi:hypothetical protein